MVRPICCPDSLTVVSQWTPNRPLELSLQPRLLTSRIRLLRIRFGTLLGRNDSEPLPMLIIEELWEPLLSMTLLRAGLLTIFKNGSQSRKIMPSRTLRSCFWETSLTWKGGKSRNRRLRNLPVSINFSIWRLQLPMGAMSKRVFKLLLKVTVLFNLEIYEKMKIVSEPTPTPVNSANSKELKKDEEGDKKTEATNKKEEKNLKLKDDKKKKDDNKKGCC